MSVIKDKNRIIADFMQCIPFNENKTSYWVEGVGYNHGFPIPVDELKYASDWNWLMKVIQHIKIQNRIYNRLVESGKGEIDEKMNVLYSAINISLTMCNIDLTYNNVVDYIEYLNSL